MNRSTPLIPDELNQTGDASIQSWLQALTAESTVKAAARVRSHRSSRDLDQCR